MFDRKNPQGVATVRSWEMLRRSGARLSCRMVAGLIVASFGIGGMAQADIRVTDDGRQVVGPWVAPDGSLFFCPPGYEGVWSDRGDGEVVAECRETPLREKILRSRNINNQRCGVHGVGCDYVNHIGD